jgi:predicted DNA-binding protein (MmcQ/YjbR family)
VTRDRLRGRLLKFGLKLPGAWEDHPWGERVLKVGRKVFVFFGMDDWEGGPGMTVKLIGSHAMALMQPGVEPSGYGLARTGWVSIKLLENDLPYDVLRDWIVESYRIVAPRKLVAQLDAK